MTFTIMELLGILTVVITMFGIAAHSMRNLWKQVTRNGTMIRDFKLEVAEKYVNAQRITDMEQKMLLSEERLHSSLENLSSRIDRLLERMEKRHDI